jgi:hypothetical protein
MSSTLPFFIHITQKKNFETPYFVEEPAKWSKNQLLCFPSHYFTAGKDYYQSPAYS